MRGLNGSAFFVQALVHHLRSAILHIAANERLEAERHIRIALLFVDEAGSESPLRIVRGHISAAGYAVTRSDSNLQLASEALDRALHQINEHFDRAT